MKKIMKRIAAPLLAVCMLIMGSVPAFADTGNITSNDGTGGKISCAFVDTNGDYDGNIATGRITFNNAPGIPVHYTFTMYYFDNAGTGETFVANQADFIFNTQVLTTFDLQASIPEGCSAGGEWGFEASWDDGNNSFKGNAYIHWYTDSPNVLHDASVSRLHYVFNPKEV